MAYHPALLCLLVALPAAALAVRLAWPPKPPPSPTELRALVLAPIAAAGAAALLALAAAALLSHRAEPLPLSTLLGEWEVYNDSDHQLVGLWCFEGNGDDDLTLRLIVYGFQDPHSGLESPVAPARCTASPDRGEPREEEAIRAGLGQPPIFPIAGPWPLEIGPFPIRRSPLSGLLEFDYSSQFGCGRSRLSPAWGFFGVYEDDPTGAPPGSVDTGEIVFLREGDTAVRRERRSLRWVRNHVVLSAWAALLVAWAASVATRRRGRSRERVGWTTAAVFGVAFVLFAGVAAALRPPPHAFTPEAGAGSWHLEYVSDRSRAGSFTWTETEGEPRFVGELRSREGGNGRRRVETGPVELDADRQSAFGHRIAFTYEAGTGAERQIGAARLRTVPAMTGPFHDHRLHRDCPGGNDENLNYGDFIAFKRPEAR